MRGHIAYVSNDPVEAYKNGYASGIEHAREAVVGIAMIGRGPATSPAGWVPTSSALAAIDGLRAGDHSAPRQPEGYSPTATDNRP